MPGNEVHNFFNSEKLYQRQTGAPSSSNNHNYNAHRSESEREFASPFMPMPHGLNLAHPTPRPEFSKTQSPQPSLNGYMHGHQLTQSRQNDANFLGMGRAPDQSNLGSNGIYTPDTIRNFPEHKRDSMSVEADDSRVKYDFLGGQSQMNNNQKQDVLQSFPRHQSGLSDVQPLQKQAVFRQMQELHRQQQIHQQEVRQNSTSHLSPVLINGTPIRGGSNGAWIPEHMAGNTNWMQSGVLPVMQGSSNGYSSPEQSKALQMLGLAPQKADQPLYGLQNFTTRGSPSQYSYENIDKSTMLRLSTPNNSVTDHQFAVPDQVSMQEGTALSRQGFDATNLFGHSLSQGSESRVATNYAQDNTKPRIASFQEYQQRDGISSFSETFLEKTMIQATSSQSVVSLDPTEEKILFGTDDSIWNAFGKNTDIGPEGFNMLDGMDSQKAFPSLQNGSWSALMQSAVAETSGGDPQLHDEWSGLSLPNSKLPSGTHQSSIFNDNGITNNSTVSGFQQSEIKSFVKSNSLLPMYSDRFIQESSEESRKLKNRIPIQKSPFEGHEICGYDTRSSDSKLQVENISRSWNHQGSTSLHNTGTKSLDEPNAWNFMSNISSGGDTLVKENKAKNLLQHSQTKDRERVVNEKMGPTAVSWNGSLGPELHHGKPYVGSPSVKRGNSNVDHVDTMLAEISTAKGEQDSNNHGVDHWTHDEVTSNSKLDEDFGKYQHNPNNSHQVLESSMNSSEKGVVEMHAMNNSNKLENSNVMHHSKSSHHASVGGAIENIWLDTNETRSLPGNKQKSSGQNGHNTSGSRKFQYHPMGNLDEDLGPYYETKLGTLAHDTSQMGTRGLNSLDPGPYVQSKFTDRARQNSMETEKGRLLKSQGDVNGVDVVPPKSNIHSYSNMSVPIHRPIGSYASMKNAQPSQNMLELLHKVDQSREHGAKADICSSDPIPSEMPRGESTNRYSGHPEQNHSAASPGFGLQLAPPTQRFPVSNRTVPSQSFLQRVNPLNASEDPIAPSESLMHETADNNVLLTGEICNSKQSRISIHQIPVLDSELAVKSGISQGAVPTMSSNPWSNVSTQQRLFGSGSLQNSSSLLNSHLESSNAVETTPNTLQKDNDQYTQVNVSIESGACSMNIDSVHKAISVSQEKESLTASAPVVVASTQRDIEAFGRSLQPDRKLHENYSLLHQMQAMKSVVTDSGDKNLKSLKESDYSFNSQHPSHGVNNLDESQHGNICSEDMFAYNRNYVLNGSSSTDAGFGKTEQINPRMAPSWFNQFGTFENGKIFPISDTQKTSALKPVEQPHIIGKSADGFRELSRTEHVDVATDSSQAIDVRQISMLPVVTDHSLVVSRPMKRKHVTSGLLPWHKEVSQGSQWLPTISMAEVAWAEAASRLVEKVVDEAEMMIHNRPLMLRPKQRLILTTQLLQQLIHPPPASVLAADSMSNYDRMAYFVARSTLGDACSQLSYSGSDTHMPPNSQNSHTERRKTSNGMGQQFYLKIVENFVGRANNLEADLLRLDKKTSILDLRMECQDLDKFSVINRFAKFHGRGQAGVADSSSDAAVNNQKNSRLKYVTAHPMPRNLPDRVQCLSL